MAWLQPQNTKAGQMHVSDAKIRKIKTTHNMVEEE